MKRVAIIGTGIAGLGCAYFLRDRFDLTLFEQNDYPGGHTNTVTVHEEDRPVPIDTGFMVFNRETYPYLTRLFSELEVPIKPTCMSFSVQHCPTNLEYNGGSLNLLFGQRRNLFRLRHWRMLGQIDRFNREALEALQTSRYAEYSLREYVEEREYGRDMLDFYLQPMGSAVWSTPPDKMLDFPAKTLLQFWKNHGFLGITTQHRWLTVEGGAKTYVANLTAKLARPVQLKRRALSVVRQPEGVEITTLDGERQTFDKVVLACHADQALALLGDPTVMEQDLLSPFVYQSNHVTLHTDESFMPRTRRCWAAWNYRIETHADGTLRAATHYWMNQLQGVSNLKNYFVSLNSSDLVASDKVLKEIAYEHPLFDRAAIQAQKGLPDLNRLSQDQTTYYAGAWFKYGFHEDGLRSGLECARAISGEEIWP